MFLDYLFSPSLEKNDVVSYLRWIDEYSKFVMVQKNSDLTVNGIARSHVGLSK